MDIVQKIKAGNKVYGTCITSYHPFWPAVAKKAALDFVFIDTEHIALDRTQIAHMCTAYKALGITPIVRIPKPDSYLACQMIDAGAKGIVAPYLEEVSQVRELVAAVKFRPLKGEKLQRIINGGEDIPSSLGDYIENYNKGNICIANIESVPAMENLETLLSVEGLDAVFIGPHDLSVSLGLPEQYDHPAFRNAVREIIQTCIRKNIGVGIHFSEKPERQMQWMEEGINMVVHSSDYAIFNQKLKEDIQMMKKANGEEGENHESDMTVI